MISFICNSTFPQGPGSSVVVQKGESLSEDNTLFGLGPLFEECKEWTFDLAPIAFAEEKDFL